MKVRVTMKSPDSLDEAVGNKAGFGTPASEEAKDIICSRWMQYGEYLDVEFDTDLGTATVLEIKRERLPRR